MLIEKINGWVQNGPMGNDKQIDPVTAALVYGGTQVIGALGGAKARKDQAKASAEFQANIEELAGDLKIKAEEFFDIADDYMPGGKFWDIAHQSAIDTAFFTAQKGEETMLSKNIELSDYGTSTLLDVTEEKFTSDFMTKYKPLAEIGVGYDKLGAGVMGDYANLMSSGHQAEYMSDYEDASNNWMTGIGDMGNMALQYYAMGGGFGGGGDITPDEYNEGIAMATGNN